MATKNCLLTSDLKGNWILRDRNNAFEATYSERFNYFLENSNDKTNGRIALTQFINELCLLDVFADLVDKTGVDFIDIGACDGSMALPAAKILNSRT